MKISLRSGRTLGTALAAICLLAPTVIAQEKAIYPDKADVKLVIQKALAKASREHKRVLLDFGGNWCGDCRALDAYFHKEPNASLLRSHFILIDVNIGRMNMNLDIAKQYEVPLDKGVPAMAVVDAHGQLLYSQQAGEFEAMRTMDAGSVTAFLNQWKG